MFEGSWLQLAIVVLILLNGIIGLITVRSIRTVHIMINSRLSELLALTAKSSFAEGQKSEGDKNA